MDCSCVICQRQCKVRPGWFLPEEIHKLAKYFMMSVEEVFFSFLAVDWHDHTEDGEVIFLIAPALKDSHTGVEYPSFPSGECTFFMNNKCSIYPARPADCRLFDHMLSQEEYREKRFEIAEAWRSNKQMIEDLLGRPPQAKEFTLDELTKRYW